MSERPRTMTAEREAEFWRVLEMNPKLWLRHKEDDALFERIAKSLKAELDAERAVSKALADALDGCVTGKYGGQPGYVNTLAISQARAALAQYAASHPEKEPK